MNLAEFITILGIGIGLSMDAFAVSIAQGACLEVNSPRYPLAFGITFGFFQALMPLVGWLLGARFNVYIKHVDHWIAFTLLAAVGIKMFADGMRDSKEKRKAIEAGLACPISCRDRLRKRDLLAMGIATSIDALAVGVSFGMLGIGIWSAIAVIGCTTLVLSSLGVYVGKHAGPLLGDRMEMTGAVVLVAIGAKILVEHLYKGI